MNDMVIKSNSGEKSGKSSKNGDDLKKRILDISRRVEPRIMRKGEKRARLLEAALKLFERYGYKKTAVDDIAREADVAKGTVYLYFRNKRDIMSSIFHWKISEIMGLIANGINPEDDAPTKLLNALRILIEQHRDDEVVNRVLAADVDFLGPILMREIGEIEKYIVAFISNFILDGIDEGSIRPDIDVEMTALMIMRLNQANILRIKTGEPVDVDKYIEIYRKVFFEGLASTGREK